MPQTGTALVLLVAFALPGFITVLIQERTFRRAEDPTPLDRLLRVLYYSVWCYVLVAVVALTFGVDRPYVEDLYDRYEADPAQLIWRASLALLIPSLVVANATRLWTRSGPQRRLLKLFRINERHEQPTGWDFYFEQHRSSYVRLAVKGGGWIYGFYGSKSFAAYAKDGGDLYLERTYASHPDHKWFGQEMTGNQGQWIKMEEVVCAEFYNLDYEAKATIPIAEISAPSDVRTSGDGRSPGPDSRESASSAAASAEAE